MIATTRTMGSMGSIGKTLRSRPGSRTLLLALGLIALTDARGAAAQGTPAGGAQPKPIETKERTMKHAKGDFEVKATPQPLSGPADDALLGRLALVKTFKGELTGTGNGQMLTAGTAVEGSMAYVAMERVTATLEGRHGSFVLVHRGVMTKGGSESPASGAPDFLVTVLPDSGTEGLAGLTGRLNIQMEGGKHSYDLEYSLPPLP